MNTLKTVMSSLSEARTNKDTAKDRWLTALENGSEDLATCKQAFHSADEIYANGAQTLTKAITDLKNIFCFELALSLLDREETQTLAMLVAELRLDHLTDPHQILGLPALAQTWYRAEGMREAAKTIAGRFSNRDAGETIASILADLDHARKPEAWAATVEAYNFIYPAMEAQNTEETGDALTSSVLHFLNRHLLKQYDDLTEKLADKLEDAYYGGNISSVLEDLAEDTEPTICRVIQDALSSGLIRLRQPQAEEKPETRSVIDPELEEEQEEQGEAQE